MRAPERICIEMIIDAEAIAPHAHAINYLSAKSASGGWMTLCDELTGDVITVHPKIVVNAAGPWIDSVNDSLYVDTKFIGGTKGSHLVLDHPELRDAIGEREFFFELPLEGHDLTLPFQRQPYRTSRGVARATRGAPRLGADTLSLLDSAAPRPSIETLLHAFLPHATCGLALLMLLPTAPHAQEAKFRADILLKAIASDKVDVFLVDGLSAVGKKGIAHGVLTPRGYSKARP